MQDIFFFSNLHLSRSFLSYDIILDVTANTSLYPNDTDQLETHWLTTLVSVHHKSLILSQVANFFLIVPFFL